LNLLKGKVFSSRDFLQSLSGAESISGDPGLTTKVKETGIASQ
jgi:hypothetical protein